MRGVAWFGAGVLLAGCTVLFAPDSRNGNGDGDDDGGSGRDGASSDSGPGADGGDPDANTDPDRARLVFASSQQFGGFGYGGTVPMAGLASADELCQGLAEAEGIQGEFLAWLSDSTGSPSTRFSRFGRFVLANGTEIADDWADLTDGQLDAAINLTETGTLGPTGGACTTTDAWTNTLEDGTISAVGSSCANWTGIGLTRVGARTQTNSGWTASSCDTASCTSSMMSLYCFEQ